MVISAQNSLTLWEQFLKRWVDFLGALLGLGLTWWIILISYILASIDTRANGFFIQKRVGRNGKLFYLVKLRTMRSDPSFQTNVTTDRDPRITSLGRFFRKTKLDELPQLFHILLGQMSFVGPRPDVPGFADNLSGDDRIILSVSPGITGPATLKYRNEESILAQQENPERYNDEVIYPDKIKLNKEYVKNYSLRRDIEYIWQTIFHRKGIKN